MRYIDLDKNKIPYEFEISLKGETFQFEVLYNTVGDFFTINLYKDHKLVRYGEKIVYNVPLFENLQHLDVPRVWIFPHDTTNKATVANFDNINEDVFLYVLD